MGEIDTLPPVTDKNLRLFDDVIRQRAIDEDQTPLLAYPESQLGITDYEFFTGKKLNRLVDGAAKALIKYGVNPVYSETTVGIYGNSNIDYLVTIFGLGRLGYTTFILSPRLPVTACVSLLKDADATLLFHDPKYFSVATKTAEQLSLKTFPILVRSDYDLPNEATPPFVRSGIDPDESSRKVIIMHSSGTTGIPRPIIYTHKHFFNFFSVGKHKRFVGFLGFPFFHAHGFVSVVTAIYGRKTMFLFNCNIPQTNDTVSAAIRAANPEVVYTVPYILKLLAESDNGLDCLKGCKMVSSAGSKCPDELGNLLVNKGIHFGMNLGSTEVGLLFSSLQRPREDKMWDYLRPVPSAAPFIRMKHVDGEIYECIVLEGHKGKLISNSNDPPNSYHTKDLFIAHQTIPDAWKFVGRLDDRITLTNGEKVLPLPIEGRIQQDPLVKNAVVFGIDRPVPGLLLFRAAVASTDKHELTDEEFIDRVWPAIEAANSRAEGFSQISKDMVAVIPADVQCPITDKSSIKRSQVYQQFASVIDDVYARLEDRTEGSLKLNMEELKAWIIEAFEGLGIHLDGEKSDFFASGVDSLKAIQMRGLIIKSLYLGGKASKCHSMIVYNTGNVDELAKTLYAYQTGNEQTGESQNELEKLAALTKQYSVFSKPSWKTNRSPDKNVVILTGATGFLGSHILTQLIASSVVSKIYCLVRPSHPSQTALERLNIALQGHGLSLSFSKIHPIFADLSKENFNLPSTTIHKLKSETTHIIHCAWAVNFTLSVQSFVPQLAGLYNLIDLSLSTHSPTRLLFISSIGAAITGPSADQEITMIPESPAPLTHLPTTGYGCSKLIGERMVEAAASSYNARATVLRVGQIVPCLTEGSHLWNPNESIPLLVRTALTTGSLPRSMSAGGMDLCSWIPVDITSKAILEIGFYVGGPGCNGNIKDKAASDIYVQESLVHNLVHPRPFSWVKEFLPALKKSGLVFETVDYRTWLDKVKSSEADVKKNPSRKLLAFWETQAKAASNSVGNTSGEVLFATKRSENISQTLRSAERFVDSGIVKALVDAWKEVW